MILLDYYRTFIKRIRGKILNKQNSATFFLNYLELIESERILFKNLIDKYKWPLQAVQSALVF